MAALSKKTRITLLIVAGAILLTALLAVWGVIMVNTLTRHRLMNNYLAPYSERATAYLAENEAFTETYGEVTLHVKSYTYSYLDSAKHARPPFGLGCPATETPTEPAGKGCKSTLGMGLAATLTAMAAAVALKKSKED